MCAAHAPSSFPLCERHLSGQRVDKDRSDDRYAVTMRHELRNESNRELND